MLLAADEQRPKLADRLAAAIHDPCDPTRVTHAMADILRARILAIACGYKDAIWASLQHCRIRRGRLPGSIPVQSGRPFASITAACFSPFYGSCLFVFVDGSHAYDTVRSGTELFSDNNHRRWD